MSITIPELARLCRVSRGTIDRALNDRPGISEQTRARILRVAREHNYTPNKLARCLATGKTGTIGIVVFDLKNRHFAQLINAIEVRLANLGYISYICITDKDKQRELHIVSDLLSRNVEGLIIMPVNQPEDFDRAFGALKLPLVAVNNRLSPRFSYVGGDFASATYAAMTEFAAHGYRHISFICPAADPDRRENAYAQIERAKGYRRFMDDHGEISGRLITSKDYVEIILRDLQTTARPGYFCSSDYYALHILRQSHLRGLRIPQDFGLMGFDGIDTLDYLQQPLATIHYPPEAVGLAAIELLLKLMDKTAEPQEVLLSLSPVAGQSL